MTDWFPSLQLPKLCLLTTSGNYIPSNFCSSRVSSWTTSLPQFLWLIFCFVWLCWDPWRNSSRLQRIPSKYSVTAGISLSINEAQNHRISQVGRDLWKSLSPIPTNLMLYVNVQWSNLMFAMNQYYCFSCFYYPHPFFLFLQIFRNSCFLFKSFSIQLSSSPLWVCMWVCTDF